MDIAIAGAHGRTARLLARTLVARGDTVRGLVRDRAHLADLRDDGAEPSLCDLARSSTAEIGVAIDRADCVVLAVPPGGASSGDTTDAAAVRLLEATIAAHVPAYVMVSPAEGPDLPAARAAAEQALMDAELRWTIVRPGPLSDAPAAGAVRVARALPAATTPRGDVAALLAAIVRHPLASDRVLSVTGPGGAEGDDGGDAAAGGGRPPVLPVDEALEAAIAADPRMGW